MKTKETFIDAVEYLMSLEQKARQCYDDDIKYFSDEFIVETLTKIRDDEIRHVQIVHDIISLLDS